MPQRLSAIVLAAGDAKVMETAKLLLPIETTPLIRRTVNHLTASPVVETIVVGGADTDALARALDGSGARIVSNPAYRSGVASSIAAAVQAAGDQVDGYLFLPADMPFVTTEIVSTLIGRFQDCPEGILVPAYQRVPGYPILIERRYRDQLLAMEEGKDLHALLRANARDVLDVHFLTDAVVFDVDDVDDYDALHRRLGLPSPVEETDADAPTQAPSV